jgi:LacI family transcriptional regulator, galactose operon repressor
LRERLRYDPPVATMSDVARLAGVSVSTVSHVLNQTRPVSQETADRVREAIGTLGYSRNTIARALVRANTNSIGLCISIITNPYFNELVHAIEGEAGRYGHTLLLGDTLDDAEHELRIVRALHERRVDGMILAPSPGAATGALRHLVAAGVPTVLIDRFVPAGIDQVGVENTESMAALVEHLAGHGHRRIGMISGMVGLSTSDERVAGYRLGLVRSGLRPDPVLEACGASQVEPARAAVERLLGLPSPPSAIVIGNNLMTLGALRELRDAGRRVPEDVALAAFDDFPWAELVAPPLTTIAQPTYQIGVEAVRLLLERIAEPDRRPVTTRLEPRLVRRQSCGCPPPGQIGQDVLVK